jgi:hypothetical protein
MIHEWTQPACATGRFVHNSASYRRRRNHDPASCASCPLLWARAGNEHQALLQQPAAAKTRTLFQHRRSPLRSCAGYNCRPGGGGRRFVSGEGAGVLPLEVFLLVCTGAAVDDFCTLSCGKVLDAPAVRRASAVSLHPLGTLGEVPGHGSSFTHHASRMTFHAGTCLQSLCHLAMLPRSLPAAVSSCAA